MKWYLGGVAGDELTALDRIKRGQLDGEAGAIFCQRLAPSLRVARVPGMFDSRDEFNLRHGAPQADARRGVSQVGLHQPRRGGVRHRRALLARSRSAPRRAARRRALWAWNLDPVWQDDGDEMGMKTIVTTIEEHSPAWRRKAYDAFFCVPGAALAYQWTTETELRHRSRCHGAAGVPGGVEHGDRSAAARARRCWSRRRRSS